MLCIESCFLQIKNVLLMFFGWVVHVDQVRKCNKYFIFKNRARALGSVIKSNTIN